MSILEYPHISFFQVVWKDSKKLGCGITKYPWKINDDITYYVTVIVARYTPIGNFYMTGQKQQAYDDNVKPLGYGGTVMRFI